jgi:predicted TIM-barrel fold metal-dependent hydrolase
VRDSWITPEMGVLRRDFLPEDAAPLLATAGFDGVVAVQADQSAAETQFLLDLAARHPIIRGVVGWIEVVARCPGGRFVLDHCAKPAIAAGEMVEWRAGIESLARHPNVYCKISGLVTEATWYGWTDADIFPYLDAVAAVFGIERLIFASDFPVSLLSASYADVVALATRWAAQFTAHERDLLFGGTATAVYHLEN